MENASLLPLHRDGARGLSTESPRRAGRISPGGERSPAIVAAGRVHAVATVLGWRERRPIGPVARHGDAVDEQLARADEVTAVAAADWNRALVASRRRTQVSRLVGGGTIERRRV